MMSNWKMELLSKVEEKDLIAIHKSYTEYMENTPAIFKGIIFFDWRS